MANDLEVLSRLLPLKWRGIEVPSVNTTLSFSHRLVEHEQVGVNGAHVENTGRKAAEFSFRILFRGGITGYTDLYPSRFREFWDACLDGSVGILQHPEFGQLDAKVQSFSLVTDASRRDGHDLDIVWKETIENGSALEFSAPSPIDEAIMLASQLDTQYNDVAMPEYDDGGGLSLSETLASIKGQLLLAQLDIVAISAQLSNAINAVNGMIDLLGTLSDIKSSPAIQSLKSVEAALSRLNDSIAAQVATAVGKRLALRIAQEASTVARTAAYYGMGLAEFIALNPKTASTGKVSLGEEIFVYE